MGGFTIGVVAGVSADKWLRIWAERYPAVPVAVVTVDGDPLPDDVAMAFVRLPVRDPDAVHVIPLWEEVPVVVAARDHPVKVFDTVTLAEIADEELRPGHDEQTLDLVAAGHGIARMPQSVFRATGRRDLVARPVSDAAPTRIALVWPRDGASPHAEDFVGVVRGRTANSSRGQQPVAPAAPAAPPRDRRRRRR